MFVILAESIGIDNKKGKLGDFWFRPERIGLELIGEGGF
jgi:hypothetical protein